MIKLMFPLAETTDGITVRVAVNYLEEQSSPDHNRWFWAYHIRIENHRDGPVQLLTRHWQITDGMGVTSTVEGAGVVGEQPVIKPGSAHDYVSGCPLPTPDGSMQGYYMMAHEGEGSIMAAIPLFRLEAPASAR